MVGFFQFCCLKIFTIHFGGEKLDANNQKFSRVWLFGCSFRNIRVFVCLLLNVVQVITLIYPKSSYGEEIKESRSVFRYS